MDEEGVGYIVCLSPSPFSSFSLPFRPLASPFLHLLPFSPYPTLSFSLLPFPCPFLPRSRPLHPVKVGNPTRFFRLLLISTDILIVPHYSYWLRPEVHICPKSTTVFPRAHILLPRVTFNWFCCCHTRMHNHGKETETQMERLSQDHLAWRRQFCRGQ